MTHRRIIRDITAHTPIVWQRPFYPVVMLDADVLHHDLTAFDKACQRLYDDGLLSEETLVRLRGVVHREAWEMETLRHLEN